MQSAHNTAVACPAIFPDFITLAATVARVRRIKGQLEGIERALDSEAACVEVLRQIASVRGAVNGLTAEVMEDYLREHVLAVETDRERNQGGEEMIEVIRAYMK